MNEEHDHEPTPIEKPTDEEEFTNMDNTLGKNVLKKC